jgi:glycosyltransferase involved in cell wall biosynthesis
MMSSTATTRPEGFRLISFVCETDADLLPHFVRWYRRLGVDRFHFVMHGKWSRENLTMLAGLPGVECSRWVTKPFCKSLKCDEITAIARRYVGEWVVFADADELLELPTGDLTEAIAALEAAGSEELYATLLQRVAADGSLPEVRAASDLDLLFPMHHIGLCEDMGLEKPAWKSKYPLARIGPHFVYQRGNHLPGNSRSVAHMPLRAVMHHFKWRKSLLKAFEQERGEGTNSGEMAVYRRYLESQGSLPMAGAKKNSTAALLAEGLLRLPTTEESNILKAMIGERKAAEKARIRVGFVTFELAGPGTPNGGIATAISSLAKLQAAHGHEVQVFYCPFREDRELHPLWFEYWAAFGVRLHHIPRVLREDGRHLNGHEIEVAIVDAVRRAGPFDLLHFHDTQGYAAPFAMLKTAGLEFTDTQIAITTHGGTRWHNEPNNTPWDENAYRQELVGQRLCDLVVSPSAYLIEWNRRLDALPARHTVLQNVLEPESKSFTRPLDHAVVPECLAFFGRVETRKGFDLFLASLRALAATTDLRPDVLILGRFGNGYSQERFDRETAGLPFRISHFQSLNPQQALRMLKEKRALAIMPSRQENSPYVAYEAMENQLPFLVSFTGGTAELIRPEDWPQAELPAEPKAMAEKIAGVLRHGLRPARLAFDPLEVELQSLALWRTLATEKSHAPARPASHALRLSLTDAQAATGRDPQEIIALVPPGIEVNDRHIDAMARLLAACPEAGVVEPYCRVVDEETGAEMSSLELKKKATPREAALIAGPLPLVVRAGVLADLSPALAAAPPADLSAAFMAAAEEAGTAVLFIPLETHRSRFVPGIEQRSICNRLWLPLGRKRPAGESVSNAGESPLQAQESPQRPAEDSWQLCGMLSDHPFVAISMFTDDCPYGALSLFPEAFQEKPSLHLITMDHSLLWAASTLLPQRLAEAGKRWPQARFRLLAADEAELRGLRAAGLPAMLCNLNMFTDERVFHPFRPEAASQTTDAICIAPLDLRENHHLARSIGSIGIVHHRYEGMDDVGAEVRRLLPRATFLNDTTEEPQGFFYPSDEQLAGWICQATTGLALSETGGSCFATAQYLLCGTPVVTVPSIGGRDHFLKQPFFVRADATAESVAAAVAELRARRLSRNEINEATKKLFREARQAFLDDLNATMRDVFGSGHRIDDVSGLVGQVIRYRRAVDVLRPPGAPRQAAAPRPRRWPAWLTLNRRRGENRE